MYELPTVPGEEGATYFVKDGTRYRFVRVDDDTVLIHREGAPDFVIEMVNFTADGSMFDMFGRTGVSVSAPGADWKIFPHLF